MIAEFPITVLHTQVVVHLPGLPRPGLLWNDDHVAQGFAWSQGIVSFGVPDHDGQCLIRVDTAVSIQVDSSAAWAVQTPFELSATPLKIGTIGTMKDVRIPLGKYNLVFEALLGASAGDYAFVLKLIFVPSEEPEFKILKQGAELTTDKVLSRDAQRA
ncbi:competence protein ComJ [Rhizobium tumorigenes]|uniref:Competence protein ComJ n=1 Tax=Rhizobium tumorigenes TaxID=2041385 RepID=A0AAF1KWQ6_9HYPH|nr:competence protein ComJ [Rhizobium tumorigenes]WFR97614.1 competence protein ComJ [Rhizobium tumorigenes]